MVNAVVLMNVKRNKINETAEKLSGMTGISEVYSVGGRYDLIAIVRAESNEELANLVTHHFLNVDSIEKTETLIAFKAYSRHDLEKMFAIGFSK